MKLVFAPTAEEKEFNRSTLSEQIAELLKKRILESHPRPGDTLPGELELSGELKVSRGIVREALRLLSASGFIKLARGKRPEIRKLDGAVLGNLLVHAVSSNQASTEDVFELRIPIECEIASLAAKRRTKKNIAALKECMREIEKAGDDLKIQTRADFRFHQSLAEATGNRLFAMLIMAVRPALEMTIEKGIEDETRPDWEGVIQVHRKIFDAVIAGDSNGAATAMRESLS